MSGLIPFKINKMPSRNLHETWVLVRFPLFFVMGVWYVHLYQTKLYTFCFRKHSDYPENQRVEDLSFCGVCSALGVLFSLTYGKNQIQGNCGAGHRTFRYSTVSLRYGFRKKYLYLRSTPHPVTVTTRSITFLVGKPYKPSFASHLPLLLGGG